MAKKTKKKEGEPKKVVAKCDNPNEVITNSCFASEQSSSGDQSKELVANHDQLDDVVEISSTEDIDITKLIVVVEVNKC